MVLINFVAVLFKTSPCYAIVKIVGSFYFSFYYHKAGGEEFVASKPDAIL